MVGDRRLNKGNRIKTTRKGKTTKILKKMSRLENERLDSSGLAAKLRRLERPDDLSGDKRK